MITFTSYASSSGGNAYVVSDGEHRLGIEAGLPFRDYQRLLGFGVTGLAGVLCSHAHSDHARAVKQLLKAAVDVYASAGTFKALGVDGSHRAHVIASRKPAHIGPWTVLPFDVPHDAPEPLGFVITGPSGDRLLFATDAAYLPYTVADLNVICLEVNFSLEELGRRVASGAVDPLVAGRTIRNHASLERALDTLRANDLSKVREIHLLHLSSRSADEVEFKAAVERATGVPTYVAAERSSRDSL